MVTLFALQKQRQNLETNVQIYCQYVRSQNVTRYRIRMEREMCQPPISCYYKVRSLFKCVRKFKFRKKSKWMTAGICFLSLLYGGGARVHGFTK